MQIDKINIHKISLPFFGDFSHSLRKGASAGNIVVEVIADGGQKRGYGEGAPRLYVTQESQKSAVESIRNFLHKDSFPWKLNDVTQIWNFVDSLPNGKDHNAAVCALELSLLDVLGQKQGKTILEYFPQDFLCRTISYGAALPLDTKARIAEIGRSIQKMGIKKLKLKMGTDYTQNKEAVEAIGLVFGDDYELKIDINCVWDHELALQHIPLIRDYKIKIVEQPMMPDDPDIAKVAELLHPYGIILMADESACSLTDVHRIVREGHYKMINVRLSKCGGFRNSYKIIGYLRKNGIPFQIACQLGESGILSAAGRALSLLCADAAYYDGSYDAFLLKENITSENVTFGFGGEAGPLQGSGLGVTISKESLERLSTDCTSVTRPWCSDSQIR